MTRLLLFIIVANRVPSVEKHTLLIPIEWLFKSYPKQTPIFVSHIIASPSVLHVTSLLSEEKHAFPISFDKPIISSPIKDPVFESKTLPGLPRVIITIQLLSGEKHTLKLSKLISRGFPIIDPVFLSQIITRLSYVYMTI